MRIERLLRRQNQRCQTEFFSFVQQLSAECKRIRQQSRHGSKSTEATCVCACIVVVGVCKFVCFVVLLSQVNSLEPAISISDHWVAALSGNFGRSLNLTRPPSPRRDEFSHAANPRVTIVFVRPSLAWCSLGFYCTGWPR